MDLLLVGVCLAVIVGLYFHNNPMGHNRRFMMRRFINYAIDYSSPTNSKQFYRAVAQ